MNKYIQITEGKTPIGIVQANDNEQLKELIVQACAEHFVSDDIHFIREMPDMAKIINQNGQNVKIIADECKLWIDLKETWLYTI